MNKLLQLFYVFFLSTFTFSQTALIEIPITFDDGISGSTIRIVGLDPNATDGIDESLGEALAPPKPPQSNIFDVRFILPNSDETLKDIRIGDNTAASIGNIVHNVNYQLGSGSSGLQISWSLPYGVGINIKDQLGGILFNVDYPAASTNSYTVPYPALTNVSITIKYIDSPFPVELESFTGKIINDKVLLNWKTATEVNNYGFDIEKKNDDNGWEKIGFVQGNGNSNSPKYYQYSDNNLLGANKFYYRLKQIDNDGKYEYSEVVEIDLAFDNFELFQNYPNPFNPSTTISFLLSTQGNIKLSIFNMLGELVHTIADGLYTAGYYEVNITLSNLSSGAYICRIESDNFIQTKKMTLLK
jgi:hypothetical protein